MESKLLKIRMVNDSRPRLDSLIQYMRDEARLIATPFRDLYERFRAASWTSEPYAELETICCFNEVMRFGGAGENE